MCSKDLKEFISEHRKIDIDFRFTDSKVLFCLVSQQLMMLKDDIVFFIILNDFYVQFLNNPLFLSAIAEIQNRIKAIDPNNYEKPLLHKSVAKNIISFYFLQFLKENEIELFCEIEKEKSEFYVSKYDDFSSLAMSTNSDLDYLIFVKEDSSIGFSASL